VTRYGVKVVAGSGDRIVTSVYELEVLPGQHDQRTIRTTHTEGVWEEHGASLTFDSDSPKGQDPWYLSLQHAISAVPTEVLFDDDGRPIEIVRVEGWTTRAKEAADRLELPNEAASSERQLLDPDGVIRDLQRDFPGRPVLPEWRRSERIAGIGAERVEKCVHSAEAGLSVWTCDGVVEGPQDGPFRLVGTTSRTRIAADKRGLVEVESEYFGTLVATTSEGKVIDRPIGGKRRILRQGATPLPELASPEAEPG
jgi:hypothetical protein